MIVSETSIRSCSRWLQASVLLCAAVVLPLGMAYAQDYDAIEKRLGAAVSKGELTLKQAVVMMDALREAAEDGHDGEGDIKCRFGAWIGSVGERLKAAVKAGKLSEEDAWRKWHHFKENELAPKLKATVEAGNMSEPEARKIWHDVEKAEAGERLKAAVAKGEMTEEEARAKWAEINKEGKRDEGLAGHYKRMGVSGETLGRIKKALAENGIEREQIEPVLGGMLRVIHQMRAEGEDFELDPRLRNYFEEEVGLTDEQMELVQRLARRIAHGRKDSNRQR